MIKQHKLNIHLNKKILGSDTTKLSFVNQFIGHLNIMLQDAGRQFVLGNIDQSDWPTPEVQPHILPDLHDIELYLFDQVTHPTIGGTLTVGGDGRVILIVPCSHLWLVGSPDFNLQVYSRLLSTTIHEFEHSRGKRGEGYMIKNANPPPEVPMPTLNSWAYPNDIYWDSGKSTIMTDPFYTGNFVGHPLFNGIEIDLDWILKNVRPCKGNCDILKGNYRKGINWSKNIKLHIVENNINISNARVRTWSIPQYYYNPWEELPDSFSDDMGYANLQWHVQEHNNPLMAIRVDTQDDRQCFGYLSIFELEWLAVDGKEAELLADISTQKITVPGLEWTKPTLPSLPIEYNEEPIEINRNISGISNIEILKYIDKNILGISRLNKYINNTISGRSYIVYPLVKPWELTAEWKRAHTWAQKMKVIINWIKNQGNPTRG